MIDSLNVSRTETVALVRQHCCLATGKEWKPRSCHTYLHVNTPADEASTYVKMASTIQSRVDHVSAAVYTQTTDLELECDGDNSYTV